MFTAEAVNYYGTKSRIAKELGLTKQAISHWGELVPKGHAYQLHVKTNGKLKVRPELYEAHAT